MTAATDRITVLHVEDDPAFASLTSEFLERHAEALSVHSAHCAEEGLDYLEHTEVDCIVSDYEMPGRNGIDFLEAVRETHPEIPFILFTGRGSEEVASEAISKGVTDYLQKGTGTEQYELLANRITNVVEKNRVEHDLRASQRQLSLFIEQSPLGILTYDREFTITGVNQVGQEILGYDEAELRGESWTVLVPEDEYEHVEEITRELTEAGGGYHSINENLRKDGERIICEWHNRVVTDEDGAVVGIFSLFEDVTDREKRKRQHRRFQRAVESSGHAIYCTDPEGTIEYVNPAFEELTGYTAAEAIGKTPRILRSGEHEESFYEDLWRTVLDGEVWRGEVINEDKDGERYIVDQTIAPVTDASGSITEFVAVNADITEQRSTERQLEILRTAIDKAHAPLTLSDPTEEDNPLVYVNEAFTEATGYTESEALGRNCRFMQGEDTDPETVAQLREAIDDEEPITVEIRNYRKDGTPFWNELTVVPVYDGAGDLIRYLGTQRDVTERRKHIHELRRQNDRLNEFAGVVSHDLRNPLNVAAGRLQLAKDACDNEHLSHVEAALDRMKTLIDDLLTLARQGEIVTDTEPIELSSLVERSWTAVETANASLAVELERGTTIRADEPRLTQVVENLLRNAIEHGGSDVTVRVGELPDGFYIEDEGPGIPEHKRDNVFDAGYSTARSGTGFGLSIVSQIVSAHGWDVSVTEGEAGGARFEITGLDEKGAAGYESAGGDNGAVS
ncbi:PAS domain S-box protein [Halorubrum vacuolatum]|uniref:histidine kinase n=1 Tax=Halorubrum vacuolatum TaxID=63740 RepID=A0A238W1L8_HALVU|nr:PAS domain S-box protein [Halorubrum vacuolatum]SNR40033.1 PAS/PAC sensor hybrid histidine kinase [Halorubrum vacuolatum]